MEVNELDYNTQLEKLILPEYGRNVQRMVDFAVHIENKEERTKCAKTIVNIMGNIFPHLRDVPDFKHKLWDHLAIMSNFKLDIDYPYELISQEKLESKPEKLEYSDHKAKIRHYGKYIIKFIDIACEMEAGPLKDRFVEMLANQMKKSLSVWNSSSCEDDKVFDDLAYLSKGKILIKDGELKLMEVKVEKRNPNTNNGKYYRKTNNRKNQR